MAKKTYTVKTYATGAVPRSARLRALGSGAVSAAAVAVNADGHSHPNKAFLDTLGDDLASTVDGAAATRRINLSADGSAYIEYNPDTGCLICSVPIASRGDVAAFNGGDVPGGGGTGGGSDYNRLDAWTDYDSTKAGYVLSALLGINLNTRTKANADAIASLTNAIAALASTEWVKSSLAAYLKKMPELSEADTAEYVLVLGGIDGTYPIKAYDLSTHAVPLATKAANATKAAEADHATMADTATNADNASTAAEADHATAADTATKADSATKATNADKAAEADHATAADKATALATKRKIYGQDFDGSANVDGSLTLTGANNGAGLWGTSVDLQVVCTTSAGALYKAGTKAWGQSTFKDGKTYFWTEDGDTKTWVSTYDPTAKQLLLNAAFRINKGLIIQEGEKIYLSHNKTVWIRYDATRGVIVANKPIVTAGDVTAFDTQAE